GQESRFVDKSIDTMSPQDQEALRSPETRRWFTETMRESFESGVRPVARESGLYRKSWGFDPIDIRVEARLWHGLADRTVPASVGHWMAERVPNAHQVVWPEHGHFTWMVSDEAVDVFTSLTM
ncbi:MAG: hypothetical protein WBM90_05460, partial [Acidimicrobiia bacterium]